RTSAALDELEHLGCRLQTGLLVGNLPVFDVEVVEIAEDGLEHLDFVLEPEMVARPAHQQHLDVDKVAAMSGRPRSLDGEVEIARQLRLCDMVPDRRQIM